MMLTKVPAGGVDAATFATPRSATDAARHGQFSSSLIRHGDPPRDAPALDDNDDPKQLWAFLFPGKKFPKHGPAGYSLAHLAPHKGHDLEKRDEFPHPAGGMLPTCSGAVLQRVEHRLRASCHAAAHRLQLQGQGAVDLARDRAG